MKPRAHEVVNKQTRVFQIRNNETFWPTLRGAFLNDDNIRKLDRYLSDGVIFLNDYYHTRLNKMARRPSRERCVFFEHKVHPKTNYRAFYLLCWIGNYYNGAVFHVAPQYPQSLGAAPQEIERQSYYLYCRVARMLYAGSPSIDSEVYEFINQTL